MEGDACHRYQHIESSLGFLKLLVALRAELFPILGLARLVGNHTVDQMAGTQQRVGRDTEGGKLLLINRFLSGAACFPLPYDKR